MRAGLAAALVGWLAVATASNCSGDPSRPVRADGWILVDSGSEDAASDAATAVQFPHWADGGLHVEFVSIEPLGLPGPFTRALLVNEKGWVAGVHGDLDGGAVERGFLWRNGNFEEMALCNEESPVGMTDDGIVAIRLVRFPCVGQKDPLLLFPDGGYYILPSPHRPIHMANGPLVLASSGLGYFVLDLDGGQRLLAAPDASYEFQAEAVASNGWVAGSAKTAEGFRTVIWEPSRTRYLPGRGLNSTPWDLSETGFVVGANSAGSRSIATVWYGNESVELAPRDPYTYSFATNVTWDGVVLVSDARPSPLGYREENPYIWAGGARAYLNDVLPPDSGIRVIGANDVNSDLDVVGVADFDGVIRGYVMKLRRKPTP